MFSIKNSYTYEFKIYFFVAFLFFVIGSSSDSNLLLDWSQAAAWASTFFGILKYGSMIYKSVLGKNKYFLNFSDFLKTAITYPILILLLCSEFNNIGCLFLPIFMMLHAILMAFFAYRCAK